jgi:hypothetical protein
VSVSSSASKIVDASVTHSDDCPAHFVLAYFVVAYFVNEKTTFSIFPLNGKSPLPL